MAKAVGIFTHETFPKKTSIGRKRFSKCMLNKHKRRSHKRYRGQGK